MATFTNGTKQAAATFSNTSRSSTSSYAVTKAGQAAFYDTNITYDGVDPVSGLPVYYDSVGTAPSYTNQSKS
jgi:hypothetical protein